MPKKAKPPFKKEEIYRKKETQPIGDKVESKKMQTEKQKNKKERKEMKRQQMQVFTLTLTALRMSGSLKK